MITLQNDDIKHVNGGAAIAETVGIILLTTIAGAIAGKNIQTELIHANPQSKDTYESFNPYLTGSLIFFPLGLCLAFTIL